MYVLLRAFDVVQNWFKQPHSSILFSEHRSAVGVDRISSTKSTGQSRSLAKGTPGSVRSCKELVFHSSEGRSVEKQAFR